MKYVCDKCLKEFLSEEECYHCEISHEEVDEFCETHLEIEKAKESLMIALENYLELKEKWQNLIPRTASQFRNEYRLNGKKTTKEHFDKFIL